MDPGGKVLDALGNETRREIVRILARGPRAVGDIARQLPVSRPAVSKHLRILEDAGVVAHVTAGNRNVFRLDRAGFDQVRGWLDQFWPGALESFGELAEASWEGRE
jgi:DNA-binding transcriptional ArsR family regulator